jgi:hypothetical protein
MWLQMNNSLLFILAAVFGISVALVLFETPRIFVGMFESKVISMPHCYFWQAHRRYWAFVSFYL